MPTKGAIPYLLKYFDVSTVEEMKAKINDDIWPVDVPFNNAPHFDIGCALDFTPDSHIGMQEERTLTDDGFFADKTELTDIEKFNWPDPEKFIDVDVARR